MSSNRLFITLIFILSLFTSTSSAQGFWMWGRSSVPATTFSTDPTTGYVDDSGNILVAEYTNIIYGGAYDNFIVYGTDTVYNRDHIQQCIVIKSDSSGHFLWAKGSGLANNHPISMVTDHAGNSYLFGIYSGNDSCLFDTFLLRNTTTNNMYYLTKYSPDGQVLWARNLFPINSNQPTGQLAIDRAGYLYLYTQFDSGTLTLGTTTLTNASYLGDTFDIVLAKFDSNGHSLWAKSFGGTDVDATGRLTVSKTGNIYLSGIYVSRSLTVGGYTLTNSNITSTGHNDVLGFLFKTDTSGNVLWAHKLPRLFILSIINDSHDNLYMSGHFDSTIICGGDTLISRGYSDVFIGRFDSSGNNIWSRSAGNSQADNSLSIILDNCNHLWVEACPYLFSYTFSFGDSTILFPAGSYDKMVVAEYSDSGNFLSCLTLPSGGDDEAILLKNKRNGFYLIGDYVNVDMVFGVDALFHIGTQEELFIAYYRTDSTCPYMEDTFATTLSIKNPKDKSPAYTLYPNPTLGELNIYFEQIPQSAIRVEICDLAGRIVHVSLLHKQLNTLSVANLANGLYLCKIIAPDGQVGVKKIIVNN